MLGPILGFFASRGRTPFEFQLQAWNAYLAGASGLVHAPTGMGKTLAVWLGPVAEYLASATRPTAPPAHRDSAEPLRLLWLTPMRALAADTARALAETVAELGLPFTVESRTGDTSQALRARQKQRLPTVLITTPESLTLLLSYPDARDRLGTLRCVVCDEWHELLSSKRGVQTELALARLRRWNPGLRTWGLSATLGNLDQALDALVPSPAPGAPAPVLIQGKAEKRIDVETILPDDIERFPWAGHLGTRLVEKVAARIDGARSTLLFTNTRSQAELWHRALALARPQWLTAQGGLALHHGSLDRDLRSAVEAGIRDGSLRCVVCTSSLDLGVDFSPVDQVIQVGSPKGVARLMQRAGRSGHQPGAVSRVLCVPTMALELIEFAAARDTLASRAVEPRTPLDKPLDVLVQHLVTIGLGGGFTETDLFDEIRTSRAYRHLSPTEFRWALDFAVRGGPALNAYPQYQRLATDEGRYAVRSAAVARLHRLAVGTITADTSVKVQYLSGGVLGHIEESFIARLSPGDAFVFAGKTLELVRFREMTALVRKSSRRSGLVPKWGGGKTPLSTLLAHAVRRRVDDARDGRFDTPEMAAVRPILQLQAAWSRLPDPDELLIEHTRTREGTHVYLYPFEGRAVHEGLASLLAHRLAAGAPRSVAATANDYGVELLSPTPLPDQPDAWRALLTTDNLLADLLRCLNSNELARRKFRDVARVAGLVFSGYPGAPRSTRQLQASSELFFDVFLEHDPANLLLDQARREVLEEQLEVARLRALLTTLARARLTLIRTDHLTPLAFPIYAERLRTQHVSSEKFADRITRIIAQLEADAPPPP
ncbi:MAG: ligase-associated DNA damage response DEXH box helicase, partial [Phycisphaerales bacterium]|nr:ligase-associated DNA damage response DEXH box helicase [Phycisphaerales bacterium]